jgi:hypothetical protein
MYEFVDRPVRALDREACLLVWSLRAWVMARSARQCPGGVLAGPFARSGRLAALQPFLRLMATLDRHALAPMMFHPLACPRVCEQEAVLISLIAAVPDAPATLIRDAVEMLVDEAAVAEAVAALAELGAALATGGRSGDDPDGGRRGAWSDLPLWQ